MKRFIDKSHLIAFILGGLFWSFLYIFMHFLAFAKAYLNGGIIIP